MKALKERQRKKGIDTRQSITGQRSTKQRIIAYVLIAIIIATNVLFPAVRSNAASKEEQVTMIKQARDKASTWLNETEVSNLGECDNYDVVNRELYRRCLDERFCESSNKDDLNKMIANGLNADGGIGLNSTYRSDFLDSLLALYAVNSYSDEYTKDNANKLAIYLANNAAGEPDYALPLAIGLIEYRDVYKDYNNAIINEIINNIANESELIDGNSSINKASVNAIIDKADNDGEKLQVIMQLYYYELSGVISDELALGVSLSNMQSKDGSFYTMEATVMAVRLLDRIINNNKLYCNVGSIELKLNSYSEYINEKSTIIADYVINYNANYNKDFTIKLVIDNADKTVYETEENITLEEDNTKLTGSFTAWDYIAKQAETLNVHCYLMDGEEVKTLSETEIYYKDKYSEQLCLTSKISNNNTANYANELVWNDISSEDDRYGYRLYSSEEDSEYATSSTWNGSEMVKVLNVYPNSSSKNYLKEWMNNTISDSESPAGMGMFDIDTLYIGDYNNNPNEALIDANGNYRYDVIFFGSYDSNAFMDLNEESYNATLAYIKSGRGVLFGHDTVCRYGYEAHPYFAQFDTMLGIKATNITEAIKHSSSVEVVNNGFLTSYPWKLTGVLNIPYTHVWGQYSGGTLASTVWMKLAGNNVYDTDEETGGTSDAYLVTNNQLAMIQTGHSNGQATDDERKVIANVMFYLKQFTINTSVKDAAFKDKAKPVVDGVAAEISTYEPGEDGKYSVNLSIAGHDEGTNYSYYVTAASLDSKSNATHNSNTATAKAQSGIKGYAVIINDSEQPYEFADITEGVTYYEDGHAQYQSDSINMDDIKYAHICAVDNEGNISNEAIYRITGDNSDYSKGNIVTQIAVDKESYNANDNVQITVEAKADFYRCDAVGKITIETKEGDVIAVVSDDILLEVIAGKKELSKTCEWKLSDMWLNSYNAVIRWYDSDGNELSSDSTDINIGDGIQVKQILSTDKDIYDKNDTIIVLDDIYNLSERNNIYNAEVIITIERDECNIYKKNIICDTIIPGRKKALAINVPGNILSDGEYMVNAVIKSNNKTYQKASKTITVRTTYAGDYSGELKTDNTQYTVGQKIQLNKNIMLSNKTGYADETGHKITVNTGIIKLDDNAVYTSEVVDAQNEVINITYGENRKISDVMQAKYETGHYMITLSVTDQDGKEYMIDNAIIDIKAAKQPEITRDTTTDATIDTTIDTTTDVTIDTVAEETDASEVNKQVDTSDSNAVGMWIIIALMSLAIMCLTVLNRTVDDEE